MNLCGKNIFSRSTCCLTQFKSFSHSNGSSALHFKLTNLLENYALSDGDAREKLKVSASRRGCEVNINYLVDIATKFSLNSVTSEDELINVYKNLSKLPNTTCPIAEELSGPKIVGLFGTKRVLDDALMLEQLSHHGVDMNMTGNFTGSRSYYLRGSMAHLESKLTQYALEHLKRKGFKLMSVPDLVTEDILESCGVPVHGERTMVYSVSPSHLGLPSPSKEESKKVCLSGTSEMALGGWLRNRSFTEEQLPLKLCAVSRCYRAETSKLKLEQGIFRVHHFTKVEMFGITSNETGQESDDLYQELVQIQIELLQGLGLHGQVVLMPPEELGNPAYSKTDLEVWLPGRRRYAELTSASNCTSYQAARLGASYVNKKGQRKLVHTVNGTAVAVPRCIIALCETHQEATGRRALQLPAFLGLAPAHPQQFQPNETSVDTGHEHNAFLNKVMVYNEQCLRKVLPLKNYEDLIDSDEN